MKTFTNALDCRTWIFAGLGLLFITLPLHAQEESFYSDLFGGESTEEAQTPEEYYEAPELLEVRESRGQRNSYDYFSNEDSTPQRINEQLNFESGDQLNDRDLEETIGLSSLGDEINGLIEENSQAEFQDPDDTWLGIDEISDEDLEALFGETEPWLEGVGENADGGDGFRSLPGDDNAEENGENSDQPRSNNSGLSQQEVLDKVIACIGGLLVPGLPSGFGGMLGMPGMQGGTSELQGGSNPLTHFRDGIGMGKDLSKSVLGLITQNPLSKRLWKGNNDSNGNGNQGLSQSNGNEDGFRSMSLDENSQTDDDPRPNPDSENENSDEQNGDSRPKKNKGLLSMLGVNREFRQNAKNRFPNMPGHDASLPGLGSMGGRDGLNANEKSGASKSKSESNEIYPRKAGFGLGNLNNITSSMGGDDFMPGPQMQGMGGMNGGDSGEDGGFQSPSQQHMLNAIALIVNCLGNSEDAEKFNKALAFYVDLRDKYRKVKAIAKPIQPPGEPIQTVNKIIKVVKLLKELKEADPDNDIRDSDLVLEGDGAEELDDIDSDYDGSDSCEECTNSNRI